tara:strand:+ start:771 stop:980 length:210 start_codon:yes stop_codon:yes gene_type:complete
MALTISKWNLRNIPVKGDRVLHWDSQSPGIVLDRGDPIPFGNTPLTVEFPDGVIMTLPESHFVFIGVII